MGIADDQTRRADGLGGGRWAIAVLAILAALVAPWLPAAAQERWDMPTPYSDSNFHTQNIRWFADELRKATGGRIDITIHSAGSTYKMPEIRRAVENGQVALGEFQLLAYGDDDPILQADGIPFLAVGDDAAWRLYQAQKPVLEQHFQRTNARLLFSVPWPAVGMISTVRLERPQDFQGLKLRAPTALLQRLADLLGAAPTQVQQAEVPQAFGNGTLDAALASPLSAVDTKAWTYARTFYDIRVYQPRNAVIINDRLFRRLPDDLQAAVRDTAARAETRGWALSQKARDDALKALARNGMPVLPTSPALAARVQDIAQTMTEEWQARAGPDAAQIVQLPPTAPVLAPSPPLAPATPEPQPQP